MSSEYKDTFRGTAWYYARYREGYPQEFYDLIGRKFDLSKSDRVLDLGCGTGQIAVPISAFVKEVVAMDPEREMIAEGRYHAATHGAQNIVWVAGGSADLSRLSNTIGNFKLVTMGASFHWMDRGEILEELHSLVVEGGGIAIVWNTSIWTDSPTQWQAALRSVITKWLGKERRAGSGVYEAPVKRHEQIVNESKFKRVETWKYHWVATSELESVIGNLYSTSFASPHILGAEREAFEKDLRQTLLKVNPSGVFSSEGDLDAILASK